MKLDVCIPKNHEPSIMDEDELKDILDAGRITNDDYDMAYSIANEIIDFYHLHKEEYYEFINKMVKELEK